jgi:plastocyanin
MKKLVGILAILALASFAFAACGDDDDETTAEETTTEETTAEETTGGGTDTGGGTVAVSAAEDGSLAFDQSSLTASAGAATFEFENPASLGHDFCIEQDGSEVGCTDLISGGETSTLDADLEAGEYTYYCSVSGHREGGMEGTLTVE